MNVKQVAQVIDLLEFFGTRRAPATLADIARHFGWPRSSTFNLLGTLAQRGYLYEPRAREGYYPAPLWAEAIRRIEDAQPVDAELARLLGTLAAETGETVVLAAVSGQNALFVAAVESTQSVRYAAAPGKMIPLHVTATGRALLAQLPPRDRQVVLRKARFEQYTPYTLMSAEAVEAEIDASLARGWFEGRGEFTPDLGGVALPVGLPDRQLAVLVAGPLFRVRDRYPDLATRLRQALAPLAPPVVTRGHRA